jgi:hypothetical protein
LRAAAAQQLGVRGADALRFDLEDGEAVHAARVAAAPAAKAHAMALGERAGVAVHLLVEPAECV